MKISEYQAAMVALIFCLIIVLSHFISKASGEDKFNKLIGNYSENIRALKIDCEKSLPRDQECILIYEFVPVKKEKSE